ncbi:MAG TPA: biotin-dependent carboxyltransferase family protein [Gammaproteobacteria bacterium]|nr:biotin-dependent carboxyltransferase family protein [Gammaproteobacteria bacterium]
MPAVSGRHRAVQGAAMITVLAAGARTLLQDGGRIGYAHLGVPRAGAADLPSLRRANRLVGNRNDLMAGLEITLSGPTLRFESDSLLALSGATLAAELDGRPLAMHQSVAVQAGQTLVCGRVHEGVRSYLAVRGGIRTPGVLGSVATDTLSGLGHPVLCNGDVLEIEPTHSTDGFYLRKPERLGNEITLHVVPGPHTDRFSEQSFSEFLAHTFTVHADSDRAGVRLVEALQLPASVGELPSQGMVGGAVQVPGDGRPIILLPDHGATGGYPVLAVVITADHGRLGQLGAGMKLRFEKVSRDQALSLLRQQEQGLETDIVAADEALLEARSLMMLAHAHPELRDLRMHNISRRVRLRR